MSAPDKFLTDLAGLTEADSVRIEWRGYAHNEDTRFHVMIGRMDSPLENPWTLIYGYGATVDLAMADAMAKRTAHYAQEAA